jgi:hypothetical protein
MAAAAVENLAGRWSAPVLVSAISLRRRRVDHWRVLAVGFDLLATKSLQNPTLGFASVDHCVHARAPHTAGSNHSVAYSMVLRCVPRHRSSLSYVHVRRPTHGYQYHTHVPVFFFLLSRRTYLFTTYYMKDASIKRAPHVFFKLD